MTNGKKFKEVFGISQVDEGELYAFAWLPNHDAAEISIDWWNAEYKEPTTKNDLGVNLISKSDVDRIINCPYFRQADKLIQIMNLPSVTFKDQLPTKNDLPVIDKIRERVELEKRGYPPSAGYYKAIMKVLQFIDEYKEESGVG